MARGLERHPGRGQVLDLEGEVMLRRGIGGVARDHVQLEIVPAQAEDQRPLRRAQHRHPEHTGVERLRLTQPLGRDRDADVLQPHGAESMRVGGCDIGRNLYDS